MSFGELRKRNVFKYILALNSKLHETIGCIEINSYIED